MGEIFKHEKPKQNLEFTGERLTSDIGGQIELEHYHRYFFARHFVRGLSVLDIACGEGYGSAYLSQVAAQVIGVDIDSATVEHAKANYGRANIDYRVGSALDIPVPSASVDVVVSFETLEHFYEHDVFMAEVDRVLRPGGLLIISSPERDIYSQSGSNANPYHVRELPRADFEDLLRRTFPHFHILVQRPMIGSALLVDDGSAPTGTLTFEKRGPDHYEANAGLPRSPYLLAIASKKPITVAPSSLLIETSEIGPLFSQASQYPAVIAELAAERGRAANLLEQVAGQQAEIARLTEAPGQIEAMAREIDTLRRQCDAMRLAALQSRAGGFSDMDPAIGQTDEWRHRYVSLHDHIMKIVRRTPRMFRKAVRKRLLGSAVAP